MLTLLRYFAWPPRAYEIPSQQIVSFWWAKYTLPRLLMEERMRDQGGGQ